MRYWENGQFWLWDYLLRCLIFPRWPSSSSQKLVARLFTRAWSRERHEARAHWASQKSDSGRLNASPSRGRQHPDTEGSGSTRWTPHAKWARPNRRDWGHVYSTQSNMPQKLCGNRLRPWAALIQLYGFSSGRYVNRSYITEVVRDGRAPWKTWPSE